MSVEAALQAWGQGRVDDCLGLLRGLGATRPTSRWPCSSGRWPPRRRASAPTPWPCWSGPCAPRRGTPRRHFNLAVSLQAIDNLTRAITHYEQALRLDPSPHGRAE